jgi:hypothetical protein
VAQPILNGDEEATCDKNPDPPGVGRKPHGLVTKAAQRGCTRALWSLALFSRRTF